jgi:signal transduction histidine kinase
MPIMPTHDTESRLKMLQEISLAITSTLDLDSILQILFQKIESLRPYGAITFIRLLDKETGILKTLACSNITEEELKQNVLEGRIALRSIVGEEKTPTIVVNTSVDQRIPRLKLFQKYNLVSYIGLPLVIKGKTLGDISIFTREEHFFSAEEIAVFTTLAEQVAIAIHNSQLFDETKRQADELRDINEERADFTAMIVHDLHVPLGTIMGASEILQEGILGPVTDDQKKWLFKIETASRRLLELVNHFLDLSRLEAGKVDLNKKEVNLNHLIQDTLDFYQSLARGKEIVLQSRVVTTFPRFIKADPHRLAEVLENLLSNAIKFSRQGGEIEIGADRENEREVKLWVKDNGIGISPQQIGQLFEKYRQTTSGKSAGYEGGTGLGLAICKMIVEAHGGRIWVDSEEGKGTTFYLTFPIGG